MKQSHGIPVRVTEVEQITPQIKRFALSPVDRSMLPAFSGGSHIVVHMRDGEKLYRNPYSLMGSPEERHRYQISVRRADQSRGGSAFMHERVKVGTELEITGPVNLFPLIKTGRKHVMIAGGIGITPFMAYLHDLHCIGVPYELHYCVRSPEHGAYWQMLKMQEGDKVRVYFDSADDRIDFGRILSDQPLGTHVYVCGPGGMIETVISTARNAGWPDSHIHWERFSAPPPGDPFTVFLARSGVEIQVPSDQSLLEAIEAAGIEAKSLCRGGVCGMCETVVLELDGEILHYDHYLSGEEKASGKKIMPCVSRARCRRLVLDL